ncbi:MAG: TIGR01906 family membrane protein [Chloroflexi bacterium]|nr:TIGR01906 family membrane protein [Chloroflexota bacterium]
MHTDSSAIPRGGRPARVIATTMVAIATVVVILAAAVVPFLNPQWVAFEQGRSNAAAWTGFSAADLRTATDAILNDLVTGSGDFDVQLNGVPVLTDAERSHMRDVRAVFAGFYGAAAAALLVVWVGFRLARRGGDTWARTDAWRAVRSGAIGLIVGTVVVGVVATVAFDAAFDVFHRLFFSAGSYTFDPRTDRLVQLFPEQFWSETAIAVGIVAVASAIVAAWLAGRRAILAARGPSAAVPAVPAPADAR